MQLPKLFAGERAAAHSGAAPVRAPGAAAGGRRRRGGQGCPGQGHGARPAPPTRRPTELRARPAKAGFSHAKFPSAPCALQRCRRRS